MEWGVVITAVLVALSACIAPTVQFLTARNLGISTAQEALVSTLKELVDAQKTKIERLEAKIKEQADQIATLQLQVNALLVVERMRSAAEGGGSKNDNSSN